MGWILFGIVVVLGFAAISLYNRLVRLRATSQSSWSDIDIQLKRRCDLVPNLVATVEGYAAHEQRTLERVVQARRLAMDASTPEQQAKAETRLVQELKGLFALAEAYPQLRASESFQGLQRDLSNIEDAVQNARRYYNAIVRDYNTALETFPSSLIATRFGFQPREYFELDSAAERSVPKVSFGKGQPG